MTDRNGSRHRVNGARSIGQRLAERLQLDLPLRVRLRIAHCESLQRVEDDLGDDQTGVFLVVGGNHIPRRRAGARLAQALRIGFGVFVPEFALLEIRVAEFPVLLGVVDALEKTPALLLPREVEKDFDDTGSVDVEAPLKVVDGALS